MSTYETAKEKVDLRTSVNIFQGRASHTGRFCTCNLFNKMNTSILTAITVAIAAHLYLSPIVDTGGEITIESTKKLVYTSAVITEALRLFNPLASGVYAATPPGPNATSGSPDRSSEDGIEPDFKVEDEYDVNFGDLDEEISRLIKPEPLSSKASLGLYSTPPAPTPQSNVPSPLSKREPAPASSDDPADQHESVSGGHHDEGSLAAQQELEQGSRPSKHTYVEVADDCGSEQSSGSQHSANPDGWTTSTIKMPVRIVRLLRR
jgi:hypothetical protein